MFIVYLSSLIVIAIFLYALLPIPYSVITKLRPRTMRFPSVFQKVFYLRIIYSSEHTNQNDQLYKYYIICSDAPQKRLTLMKSD